MDWPGISTDGQRGREKGRVQVGVGRTWKVRKIF